MGKWEVRKFSAQSLINLVESELTHIESDIILDIRIWISGIVILPAGIDTLRAGMNKLPTGHQQGHTQGRPKNKAVTNSPPDFSRLSPLIPDNEGCEFTNKSVF
jgi:hypothetical protein